MWKRVASMVLLLVLAVSGGIALAAETCEPERTCYIYRFTSGQTGPRCQVCTQRACHIVTASCAEYLLVEDPVCYDCYWIV